MYIQKKRHAKSVRNRSAKKSAKIKAKLRARRARSNG